MKLKLHLFAFIAIITLNVSAQKKMAKVELDASKIIQLGNSVIDLGNSYSQTLNNYQNMLSGVHNNMERISKNPNLTPQAVNCNIITVQARHQTAYVTALKAAPAFDEKADIEKYVLEGEGNIKGIGKWCAVLSSYISKKEFKEDTDFAKYKEINDSLVSYLEKSSASWRMASNLASDAGNKAELILLQGSPIADFVIPMKKDLISLGAIFNMFKTETPDVNAIKSALASLTESIDKNKDISTKDTSKLKDIYYKEVYLTFYRECLSTVKTLTTVTDRLQEQEPDADNINSWFGTASGDYRKTIEKYNTFVSQ
ncbi:MAG: hypothetical protein ACK5KT_07545 [Dysgonomonas sp.]